MPVWQRIYEEINDPDFVLICAAEDTGGEAVAGPIFDAANPTYISRRTIDDHNIGGRFLFYDALGIGALIGPGHHFNLGFKIAHFSNGNLLAHNDGVTVPLMLRLGVTF